ncbi:hypothetical protein PG987_002596 [Apiospora arundinis]|uniref:SIS domain-containing protein n=1 Tax=Apiospora arundinis TaxID=335852 RepID=A0ABR2JB84_9PEZI
MVEHHPVQTSAVFLVGASQRPLVPPPSPPSPPTPNATVPGSPIQELCLEDIEPSKDHNAESLQLHERLSGAIHVLNTEATALRALTTLYEKDGLIGAGFGAAVESITRNGGDRGKLVIIGVGKSGHIGKKLVATFNSLGVHATYLHPTEALHGDLGKIGKLDTVLFITFSGKTPELLALLPHIDAALPTIVLTSHTRPDTCELIKQRPSMILVSAPIHESETASFGVSAPTTSTTVALAVGDALAIVSAQEINAATSVSSVFLRNHPGGAIGASINKKPLKVGDITVPIRDIPHCGASGTSADIRGADVLKVAYDSPTGWVIAAGDLIVSPGRIRRLEATEFASPLSELPGLGIQRGDCITVLADTRISQAAEWIRDMVSSTEEQCDEYSVLAVVDKDGGDVIGVLEASQLLGWRN